MRETLERLPLLFIFLLMFAFALIVGTSGCGTEAEMGPVGPTGPAGSQGTQGDQGVMGATGEPGTLGPEGGIGPDGDAGPTGTSSYFTGDDLVVEILGADITDGVTSVMLRLTDADGLGLDREGIRTEGAVSISFVLARLGEIEPGDPLEYTAYTTRVQTTPDETNSATQAASENDGTFSESGDGLYQYVFTATADTTAVASLTHTVAVYATRTVDDERAVANTVYHFRPDGEDVVTLREFVSNDACNTCHGELQMHGGSRRDVALCITCHSPQTSDPDTGNTVNMVEMIHQLHSGHALPSVEAGDSYEIVGFRQSTHNYDSVGFPQPLQNCASCHNSAAQADIWQTRPTMVACGSCHNRTHFTAAPPEEGQGWTLHSGGAFADDSECVRCHPAEGGLVGIADAHFLPEFDPDRPTLEVIIDEITSTGPAERPVVTFTVLVDGAPRDILADGQELGRLRLTVAGPTTDYEEYWQVRVQDNNAVGELAVVDAEAGQFAYTMAEEDATPADAGGTYSFGFEGYVDVDEERATLFNPVAFAAVTDDTPVPRRNVVEQSSCQNCHLELAEHGGPRQNVQYCAMCHTPNNTNDERVANFEGGTEFVHSVNLRIMIHSIHMGEELEAEYVLGAYPPPSEEDPLGSPVPFDEVRFPNDANNCAACHAEDTYELPLADGVRPSLVEFATCIEDAGADENDFCDERELVPTSIPPVTSVCTSCHNSDSTAVHAELNTLDGVEACNTCHAAGSSFDPALFH